MDHLENGRAYAVFLPAVGSPIPAEEVADIVQTLTLSGATVIPHQIHGLAQIQVVDVSEHPQGWHRTDPIADEALRNVLLSNFQDSMLHEDGSVSYDPSSQRLVVLTDAQGQTWTKV